MCTVICVCRYTLSFCINLTSNWPCELCPRISCISPPFVSYRHPSSSGSPAAHRSSLPLTDTQTELHYSVARVFHKNKQLCSVCELLIRTTFDLLLLMCVCSHSLLLSTCGSRSSITSRFFCRSEWASWSFTLQKTHNIKTTSDERRCFTEIRDTHRCSSSFFFNSDDCWERETDPSDSDRRYSVFITTYLQLSNNQCPIRKQTGRWAVLTMTWGGGWLVD